MENAFEQSLQETSRQNAAAELRALNAVTGQYGLSLSEKQIATIVEKHFEALEATGRVAFSHGNMKMLLEEFCDSPYIDQENYVETILELLDSFYYFKNESADRIPDDELIAIMHRHFDTICQGSLDYLSGTTLEDLCRNTRYGYEAEGDGRLF
ncbi:hypothetical protein IZU99_00120 [Oscillospiraceae bacterium CM]|nr:hypothetical protein IZU99_00120 [Oscillospiraceae bacterium CM]